MTPQTGLIRLPQNYDTTPAPGKLEQLLRTNERAIYHRFDPHTDNSGLMSFGSRQPYLYYYPGEGNKGLNALKRYESRLFPIGSAPQDVIRIAKFMTSGRGVLFLAKQFLLQTANVFNETRIYNPTSALVAAGMSITFGAVRPQRHIELGGGLLGIAKSIIGSAIPSLFGADSDVKAPAGTLPAGLPDINSKTDAKGLLRAGTANTGRARLEAKWSTASAGKGKFSLKNALSGLAKSLFGNFLPSKQDGVTYRGDEGAYGLMVGAGLTRFVSIGRGGEQVAFGQRWIGGGKLTRKTGQYPVNARFNFASPDGGYWWMATKDFATIPENKYGVKVGYDIKESTKANSPGVRYGDNVGATVDKDFGASDVMVQFGYYSGDGHTYDYPTKQTDRDVVQATNKSLQAVIDKLGKVSNGAYKVTVPLDATVISGPNHSKDGYNRLFSKTKGLDRSRGIGPNDYPLGFLKDYRENDVRMVDNTLTANPVDNSYKLPTAGHFDGINTLNVLSKDRKIDKSRLAGWNTYEPYKDDLIAFYFYDVVNEKYIPFRASIKGLGESLNASWDEVKVLGRADNLYSYSGFSRTLAMGFSININSLVELVPTWQRINYLASLVKPSNYTSISGTDNSFGDMSRFQIPPMVMLTLGDMYKYQPILIQSINVAVPDDAAWETMNKESGDWSYLAKYIKAPNVLYGQLPRQIEITIAAILLEKERAVVGGANFGHAPRKDDYGAWRTDGPDPSEPNAMHQALVVDVTSGGIFYQ